MRCDRCRELVSARLDGEDPGGPGDPDAHLSACPPCRAWAERAATVTRLARTGPAAPGPDLVAAVVARSRASRPLLRRRRAGVTVRCGLAAVGVGQLVLAAAGVAGVAGAATGHDAHSGAGALAHAAHETSAWNLAVGVGFLAVAWAGGRLVAGLLPVVGAFVGLLAVLSVLDLAADRVDPARPATHLLVVAGFVLLLLHRRLLGDDGGRAARRSGPGSAVSAGHPGPLPAEPGRAAGSGAVAREERRAA